jgi:hypothetical protein
VYRYSSIAAKVLADVSWIWTYVQKHGCDKNSWSLGSKLAALKYVRIYVM